MPKFHVDSIQTWPPFEYDGKPYDLSHLDCHEVVFKTHQGEIRFVVTYGLHCFTKDGTEHNISFSYADGRHSQAVCLERYAASKQLRRIIEQLDQGALLYHQEGERFFTLHVQNNLNGVIEPYKVCLAVFREYRVLRIHVTSAYFARTGEGAPGVPVNKKGFSIFKVALDTQKKPKGQYPKEVRNRHTP
ncbi:hypothetical protein [Pseudomonas japonica]|uniref:hypothetical protein n=1 Tax=Pseudomonas japonica TaxID=256466 RepID=UPI0015E2A56B|nr:hypothetical protein [Pseudomonas japonica]MBA1245573.1 hypothetical protein [Pseudomonas japonica]